MRVVNPFDPLSTAVRSLSEMMCLARLRLAAPLAYSRSAERQAPRERCVAVVDHTIVITMIVIVGL